MECSALFAPFRGHNDPATDLLSSSSIILRILLRLTSLLLYAKLETLEDYTTSTTMQRSRWHPNKEHLFSTCSNEARPLVWWLNTELHLQWICQLPEEQRPRA